MRMPSANDFENPPVGTWPGRCYRFVDLGTQMTKFNDEEPKPVHLIMLSWELDTEQKMADGRPFTTSRRYTFSSSEKSNFRKDLETWRGAKMTDADFGPEGFDVAKLINQPCLLSLALSKDGKYVNVNGVLKPMKGMTIPELTNPTVFLSLDRGEFSQSVFDKLSDNIKDTIKKSPEWHELQRPAGARPAPPAVPPVKAHDPETGEFIDDEIPF